jgi:translocation and assembly module TamA
MGLAGLLVVLALTAVSSPGVAARVKVEVEGIEAPAKKNVETLLAIVAAQEEKELAERDIRRLHDQAPGEIELALQPFGYYQPVVAGELEQDPENTERWIARYVIDIGEPVRIRSIDFEVRGEGHGTPTFDTIVDEFGLVEGDVLRHRPYETAKSALAFAAADKGYFDAAFDSTAIRIDIDSNTADIILHYDTGPRFKFGELTLEQQVLDPRMLEGYITFQRGDPFEIARLLELQAGLSQTPYFARIEARPRRDLAEGLEVPIEVEMLPRRTQHFEVGVGYGTDTGPRFKFKTEFRRLNRRGHRAEADLSISRIEQNISARYIMPSMYPSTRVYTIFGGYQHFEPTTSKSNKWVFGGSVTQRRWSWEETISLAFEHEEFEVGLDKGTSDLLMPGVSWKRTRADDPILPRRGTRFIIDIRGSHEKALSSSSFFQIRGDVKAVRSLGERTRIITSVLAGRTFTDEFRQLPATIRFFAGGEQTVRGYRFRALGPVDAEGNVIGGEVLLAGSAEIEYRFLEKFGVAAFYDLGNALTAGEPIVLEKGTGAGLRWVSPIGLVRIDGAYAVGTPNMVRLHVTIGPDL